MGNGRQLPPKPPEPPQGDVDREIRRFVNAVRRGELWEQTDTGSLQMVLPRRGPHLLEAHVCRGAGESGFTWNVRIRPSPAGEWTSYSGHAPDVHQAMRAAEHVIEEHRPEEGQSEGGRR